jgi:L-2-hydroxyglutarate oxidase LhgO
MSNKFKICIIGAGVVGLAIAERLSRFYENILVLEKEKKFGQHVSSRNSEVIHSGFYYPLNSLKSNLCIKGNKMMYLFADKYYINYKKCGKLIVIKSKSDEQKLLNLREHALKCGLTNLTMLDREQSKIVEPRVNCYKSLHVESTGIIDSHSLMAKLEYLSISRGVSFAYNAKVDKIRKNNNYQILTADSNQYINADIIINTSGLWSDEISKLIGLNSYQLEFYKGDYYKSRTLKNLNCLIYPLPSTSSLGIHSVLSLNGDVSFGPNIYQVDTIDYSIDDRYKKQYIKEIRDLVDFDDLELYEDFSGIRPKIKFDGSFNDFVIKNEADNGFNNFINLIGIDSPGLTSSLAIAEYVESLIN